MVTIKGVEFDEPSDDPYEDTSRWGETDYGEWTIPTYSVSGGYKCTVRNCQRIYDEVGGFKHHVAQTHGLYQTITLTCPVCDDEFGVRPSDAERRTYCSQTCRGLDQRERVELECEECGDTFEVVKSKADERRNCSNECHDKWRTGRSQNR